jgi:hypothetical protein
MNQLELTQWQKIQAAMLYRFASVEYLKELHQLVTDLINGVVDPLLELARQQGRDAIVSSTQWGERDTSRNWANNAWPFLKDLQIQIAKDIAMRGFGQYEKTAVSECLRGAEQSSMLWTTAEEEERYKAASGLISTHAWRIDKTLDWQQGGWNDSSMMNVYPGFFAAQAEIPGFRVRHDIVGESGKLPPKTGVYVSADDRYATLQFAWTGKNGCLLQDANTFSPIGREALKTVGRASLWIDDEKMYKFASRPEIKKNLSAWRIRTMDDFHNLAASAISEIAFERRATSWYFVEILDNEKHSAALTWDLPVAEDARQRVLGGQKCQVSGFYHSPARQHSRCYFEAGTVMPEFTGDYGTTIWQWDTHQN